MPAILPSIFARRCRGPQPVRGAAEPEASSAAKNAWETHGLWAGFVVAQELARAPIEAEPSRPLLWPLLARGFAHASHSSADTSATEGTASRVISDDAICPKDRALQHGLQGGSIHAATTESFRDGPLNSGLPEVSSIYVQVGCSRLGWIRPGISRFSGVQQHTRVRCCAPPRND